jgi:hypothetical protein
VVTRNIKCKIVNSKPPDICQYIARVAKSDQPIESKSRGLREGYCFAIKPAAGNQDKF